MVRTWHEGKTLHTTQFLPGLNAWNNAPAWKYKRVKREWRTVLTGTVFLWSKATGKRRLTIRRIVARPQDLIQDDDNLQGCRKYLQDILKEQGVIIDDDRHHLEVDISQEVDKKQVTIIRLEDL